MKVEDCIVSVERRTVGGCLDLGFVFFRHFALPLMQLTACFAVPCSVVVWLLGDAMRHDVFLPSMVIFAFFSMLASGAMVATVGPQVFGVPISVRFALKSLSSRALAYVLVGTIFRLSGLCLVLPLLFVMAWAGHLPEVMFLERTSFNQISQRLSWLGKGGGYSRNVGRLITIVSFWLLFAFGLFMIFDVISGMVFNAPIVAGTLVAGPDWWDDITSRLLDDPFVVVVLQLTLWLTFPIVRLAWFFCYLDQRIRNECWDLELQFRVESIRLQEQSS